MANIAKNKVAWAIVGVALLAVIWISYNVNQVKAQVASNGGTVNFSVNNISLPEIADFVRVLMGTPIADTQSFGAAAGPDHYVAETFHAGFKRGNAYSSTTPNDITIPANKLINYDFISYYPTTQAVTLTLPASSTASNLVPQVGDMQETCVYNALSNVITFAAGTGFDLEVATTSAGAAVNLTLPGTRGGCFTFMRLSNLTASTSPGDILTFFEQYIEGD